VEAVAKYVQLKNELAKNIRIHDSYCNGKENLIETWKRSINAFSSSIKFNALLAIINKRLCLSEN
jgi:hypothetical protein